MGEFEEGNTDDDDDHSGGEDGDDDDVDNDSDDDDDDDHDVDGDNHDDHDCDDRNDVLCYCIGTIVRLRRTSTTTRLTAASCGPKSRWPSG